MNGFWNKWPQPNMRTERTALCKGATEPLARAALLCEQTLGSRDRLILCPQCGAPAAPLKLQLLLALRSSRRSAIIRQAGKGSWPAALGLGMEPLHAEVCGGRCSEAWCSGRCRRLHERAHQLTCVRGTSEGHPMAELHSMGRKVSETFLLAAKAICRRVAAALSHGADGLAAAAQVEAEVLLFACRSPSNTGDVTGGNLPPANAAGGAAGPVVRAGGGLGGGDGGGGADGSDSGEGGSDGDRDGAAESLFEAWCLFHAGLSERLPPDEIDLLAPLLDQVLLSELDH